MEPNNKEIQNFSHKHPLFLCDKEDLPDYWICFMCEGKIRSLHYRCTVGCPFVIHKSCAEISLPQHIRHPFHPQHQLSISKVPGNHCGGGHGDAVEYKCSECNVVLDVKRALNPSHPSIHPHPLFLGNKVEFVDYSFFCCKLDSDEDSVYACHECRCLLHIPCAVLPSQIEHFLHPPQCSHPILLQLRKKPFWCEICKNQMKGFAYHCRKCKFYLDVHCAFLKPTKNNEGEQFSDTHRLVSCNTIPNFPHPCHACQLPLVDSIYFCTERKILLDKQCADLPQKITHLLHPHPLTLRYRARKGPWTCEACSVSSSTKFFYKCSSGCILYMDVVCASSKPTITMPEVHHHHLTFFDEGNQQFKCDTCSQPCHTPFFHCRICSFNIHVHCISTLPPEIKSRHVHTLTLSDSPVKDYPDDDDKAEYYCYACENLRELARRSYYCKKCVYVAHPHCLVPEIIRVLREKWSNQLSSGNTRRVKNQHEWKIRSLFPLSTSRILRDKGNEGVLQTCRAVLRATRQNPNLSLHLCEDYRPIMKKLVSHCRRLREILGPSGSTLKKFLDSFNEEEIEEGFGIFQACRRGKRGGIGDNPNVCIPLSEDIRLIMENLASEYEIEKPGKKWDYKSTVINVRNYLIPENLAYILTALFAKYQDFSGGSTLRPKTNMLFVMILCEALESMCSTDVVSISPSILVSWYHSFLLCHHAGFQIQFAFDRLMRVVRAHFCLQANVPVVPNLSQLDNEGNSMHRAVADKELAIIERDRGTENFHKKVDSMQLSIVKIDKEIAEDEQKIIALEQTLKEKRALRNLEVERLNDVLELVGWKAGVGLLPGVDQHVAKMKCLNNILGREELKEGMASRQLSRADSHVTDKECFNEILEIVGLSRLTSRNLM